MSRSWVGLGLLLLLVSVSGCAVSEDEANDASPGVTDAVGPMDRNMLDVGSLPEVDGVVPGVTDSGPRSVDAGRDPGPPGREDAATDAGPMRDADLDASTSTADADPAPEEGLDARVFTDQGETFTDGGPALADGSPPDVENDAAVPDAMPAPDDASPPPVAPPCELPLAPVIHIASGAEGGDGSPERPFGRVADGLAVLADGGGVARLMEGTYDETVVLIDGVHVVGGFDRDWRPGGGETLLRGERDAEGRAVGVMADGIECGGLEAVSVTTVAAAPGASAYGIVARRSPGLRLERVDVRTGPAGDGAAGEDGARGANGGNGQDAWIVWGEFDCFSHLAAGLGGINRACPGAQGGRGENMEQAPQAPGVSASSFAQCHAAGEVEGCPEVFGGSGPPGRPGDARVDLTPVEGWWPASPGTAGGPGQAHYGSAGAWARGPDQPRQILVGGGGGAGGCGGAGGEGGAGGGSAIALFVIDSPGLRVRNSRIRGGNGGLGGRGGRGGAGGVGGRMGSGLSCRYVEHPAFDCDFMGVHCVAQAADHLAQPGGIGGDGGHGADGVSLGAHCTGGALDIDERSVFRAEAGGQSEAHYGCCTPPPDARQACRAQGGVYDDARCRCALGPGCTGRAEVCNGMDDDCDGIADETSFGPPQLLARIQSPSVLTDAAHWRGDGVVFLSVFSALDTMRQRGREPGLVALQVSEDGGLVNGWARIDYHPQGATTLYGAVGPSGPAMTVSEFDERMISFTFGPDGPQRLRERPGLNYHKTHAGPGGVIDVVAAGRTEFEPPETRVLWWSRLNAELEEQFVVRHENAPRDLDQIRGSAALGDAMYFLAVAPARGAAAGDTIRWIRLDREGAQEVFRLPREARVNNVQMLSLDRETLVAAWSERTGDEAVAVYARLTAEGRPEISVVGEGRPMELLAAPENDEVILGKIVGNNLVYGRIGAFGYGTERVVRGAFSGYAYVGVIGVGEKYGVVLRNGEGVFVRIGALCAPREPDGDHDGLSDREERALYGTDPENPDSDGDGCPDGFEIFNGLMPLERDSNLDPDQDGLSSLEEFRAGGNPRDADTDDDGLEDGDEVAAGTGVDRRDSDSDGLLDGEEVNVYGADPLDADTDDDGLYDGPEVNTYGTSPVSRDTDDDGLLDALEIRFGFDPTQGDDGARDHDEDGLSTAEELAAGLDPLNPDPDGDRLLDGDEVAAGTNPRDPDSDDDTLLDGLEVALGTDPLDPDTDGDGLDDAFEVGEGLDPLTPDELDADNDEDGLSNAREVELGLDPNARDTDGDGLDDGVEVAGETNPRSADTDGDGVSDGDEVLVWGTDPTVVDTDGGGTEDGLEVDFGSDPLDPADDPRFVAEACPEDHFSCGAGNVCVVDAWRCDGVVHCPDASDENECAECSGESFRCDGRGPHADLTLDRGLRRNFCLPRDQRCNVLQSCRGSLDEIGCVCGEGQFDCGGGRQMGPCIPLIFVNDEECDCPNGSDEQGC